MILSKKPIILLFIFVSIIRVNGLLAQVAFPAGSYWSLDAGGGMSDILVSGSSFQGFIEPKLWISRPLMVGSKFGANYSNEDDDRNILTFETQVFLRWNFLQLGKPQNPINVFAQGGLGMLSAYRGNAQNPGKIFSDVTMTRGSVLAEAAAGVTIPLSERWHIEPVIRGGYPHIWGASITVGYKFKLPQSTYKEVIKSLPPNEIVKRVMITSVEYILFAGDIGRYNVGIDRDAQGLNELVLNSIAQFLKENPNCLVRIEGHANPITANTREAEELLMLSRQRSLAVAEQLKQRGISDDQMVMVFLGGAKTIIPLSDTDHRNRNRRVELILVQIDDMETN